MPWLNRKAGRAGKACGALRFNMQEDLDYDAHTIRASQRAGIPASGSHAWVIGAWVIKSRIFPSI